MPCLDALKVSWPIVCTHSQIHAIYPRVHLLFRGHTPPCHCCGVLRAPVAILVGTPLSPPPSFPLVPSQQQHQPLSNSPEQRARWGENREEKSEHRRFLVKSPGTHWAAPALLSLLSLFFFFLLHPFPNQNKPVEEWDHNNNDKNRSPYHRPETKQPSTRATRKPSVSALFGRPIARLSVCGSIDVS